MRIRKAEAKAQKKAEKKKAVEEKKAAAKERKQAICAADATNSLYHVKASVE